MKIKIRYLENFAWLVVLVILFWQFLFSKFSIVSNLALGYIAVMNILRNKNKKFFIVIGIVLLFLISYSLIQGNELSFVIRFAIIIFLLLSSYEWLMVKPRFFLKCLFIISSILVLFLIGLEAYLFSVTEAEYSFIRNEVVLANGIGDVFLYNGLYFKLELRGTSLIAFVYMLSYVTEVFPYKKRWFFRLYFLVGTILAGNFAYQLAIIVFHIVYYLFPSFDNPKLFVQRITRVMLISFFAGGLLFSFISNTMKEKKDVSSAARIEQTRVLMSDLTRTNTTLLLGAGLGHSCDVKTSWRDYRRNTYFELQTLYFVNQLGLIGFAMLLISNIILAFRKIKYRKLLLVYCVYAIYAFTNPYMWDTTHIVVIVSLLCCKFYIKYERKKSIVYTGLVQTQR